MAEIHFEHAGTRLFAVEHGAGPPVILLHGGLANHEVFDRFAPAIYPRFRVITPDLRASGRSQFRGTLTWDLLADDVAALARHLGITRAAIGGISGGAGAAVRVALRHPELTSHLIVLHPAYGGTEMGLTPIQVQAMAAMDAAGQRTVTEGIATLFPLLQGLPPEMRDRARATLASYDPASVAATTAFLRTGGHPFANAAELATIAVPTLVIPGVDPTHPVEVANVYRAIPNARLVETPDFATAIDSFLR